MINKSKVGVVSLVMLLAISLYAGLAAAQYETQKTTNITFDSNGVFTATETDIGVLYQIEGTAGATGSVTAEVYSGNPLTSATVPDGIGLTKFTIITFNMDPNDFTSATITLSYTDSDVANLESPYAVYKYLPDTNTYVMMPTTVDEQAKTLTVTLTSTDDPLFAIGGTAEVENPDSGSMTWLIMAIVGIVAVIAAVILIVVLRRSGRISF